MRTGKPLLLIALCTAAVFAFAGCSLAPAAREQLPDEVRLPGYYAYDGGEFILAVSRELWDASKPEYRGFDDPEEFLVQSVERMEETAALTGEDWLSRYSPERGGKVVVRIEATDRASHTAGGYDSRTELTPTIYLKTELFAHGMAPVYHELCHVIC